MTTAIALRTDTEVALIADRQYSMSHGALQACKVVSGRNFHAATAGNLAACQKFARMLKDYPCPKNNSVKDYLTSMADEMYETMLNTPDSDRTELDWEALFITKAGEILYTTQGGCVVEVVGPLATLNDFCGSSPYWAIGSGSHYALGALNIVGTYPSECFESTRDKLTQTLLTASKFDIYTSHEWDYLEFKL